MPYRQVEQDLQVAAGSGAFGFVDAADRWFASQSFIESQVSVWACWQSMRNNGITAVDFPPTRSVTREL